MARHKHVWLGHGGLEARYCDHMACLNFADYVCECGERRCKRHAPPQPATRHATSPPPSKHAGRALNPPKPAK